MTPQPSWPQPFARHSPPTRRSRRICAGSASTPRCSARPRHAGGRAWPRCSTDRARRSRWRPSSFPMPKRCRASRGSILWSGRPRRAMAVPRWRCCCSTTRSRTRSPGSCARPAARWSAKSGGSIPAAPKANSRSRRKSPAAPKRPTKPRCAFPSRCSTSCSAASVSSSPLQAGSMCSPSNPTFPMRCAGYRISPSRARRSCAPTSTGCCGSIATSARSRSISAASSA